MNTLAPSFLIGSSSFLQVTRTYMKAWINSNFGKFATELWPLIDVRIYFCSISVCADDSREKFSLN